LVQQSAHEERERIYRDLHDDVGSKLLSLYYRLDNESDSTLARSALEDLRDIVSRKSIESCSLADAVQQWRAETEERVRDANVALSWYAEPFAPGIVLSELQHAHLRRMLREMLSNAIIHNKMATAINVSLYLTEAELVIEVANDGLEKPIDEWVAGRGISNLRVRARDLQGELSITSPRQVWVKVSCQIPLNCIQREQP
jgi:signal transduction histidine kinase